MKSKSALASYIAVMTLTVALPTAPAFAAPAGGAPVAAAGINTDDIIAVMQAAQKQALADAAVKRHQKAYDDYQVFSKSFGNAPYANPADVIAKYQAYYDSHEPGLPADIGMMLQGTIATILDRQLNKSDEATALLDKYYALYSSQPGAINLMIQKANILNSHKQFAASAAVIQPHLADATDQPIGLILSMTSAYATALDGESKGQEAVDTLTTLVGRRPDLLDTGKVHESDFIYDTTVNELIAEKNYPEALKWAKLGLCLAGVDKQALQGSITRLASVWLAQDPSGASMSAFVAAIKQPGARNPLADVPPPTLTFESAATAVSGQTLHTRINVLLAGGDTRGALALALKGDGKKINGPSPEVERVLLASDLNFSRVNAYIAYANGGGGPDPLAESAAIPDAGPKAAPSTTGKG